MRPDERKLCGTQKNGWIQEKLAEIVKSWKSYTCFLANHLNEWMNATICLAVWLLRPMGNLEPYLIHVFEPTPVLNSNGISIGSAVFTWLTSVTDRPTDNHATRSVTLGRVYVRSTAIRPEKASLRRQSHSSLVGTNKRRQRKHSVYTNAENIRFNHRCNNISRIYIEL